MRTIDAHIHLYPTEVDQAPADWAAARGERHWAVLCTRRRRDGRPVQTLPTVTQLLASLDAAGIARAVLLGWYWETWATCQWHNRFYAECVRAHPDRLSACATLHPAAGVAAIEAEIRWAQAAGFVGLGELSPHSQAHGIDDPAFAAALDLAGELGMPVNLHVTDPDSRPFPGRVDTPAADFLRLAQAHPRTTFVLAHWGGLLPLRDEQFRQLKNVYYDTAASPLMYDHNVWSQMIGAVGAERVLFGSDFPLNLYPRLDQEPGLMRLIDEAHAAGATDAVMDGNARRLFRLPP